jgi:hypothetical protein
MSYEMPRLTMILKTAVLVVVLGIRLTYADYIAALIGLIKIILCQIGLNVPEPACIFIHLPICPLISAIWVGPEKTPIEVNGKLLLDPNITLLTM